MAGRPGRSGRRRQDHSSPLVDLDRVFADDRFIDGIASSPWGAAERNTVPGDFAGHGDAGYPRDALATRPDPGEADPLADLFQTWRDELASEPMPGLPSLHSTSLHLTLSAPTPAKHRDRRSLRPALSVAAAIAALLVGTATVGSKDAQPDSALWAITQVVWPDRVESVKHSQVASGAINEARAAIKDHRSRDAQLALLKATEALGKVDEVDGLGDMQRQVKALFDQAAPLRQTTSEVPDPNSSTALSSSADSTPPSAAPPTVLAPPLVTVVAPTSDAPAAELAGGVVGAPGQAPAPVAAVPIAPQIPSPAFVPDPNAPAPTSSDPVSASPVPVPPPPSTDPPASETTSLPPPVPVDPTTGLSTAPSVPQSAPENSPPIPPPTQTSPTDSSPPVNPSPAGLFGAAGAAVDTSTGTVP